MYPYRETTHGAQPHPRIVVCPSFFCFPLMIRTFIFVFCWLAGWLAGHLTWNRTLSRKEDAIEWLSRVLGHNPEETPTFFLLHIAQTLPGHVAWMGEKRNAYRTKTTNCVCFHTQYRGHLLSFRRYQVQMSACRLLLWPKYVCYSPFLPVEGGINKLISFHIHYSSSNLSFCWLLNTTLNLSRINKIREVL
jgi:hypothetical protein